MGINVKAALKPEIEHFKKFNLLDMMSPRHLNYLREKSIVVSYRKGDILFAPPRSESMGYYLLEGVVKIQSSHSGERFVEAGSQSSYCSLEDELPQDAVATATEKCQVLQLSRVLVERYFSWSTTGEHQVVSLEDINRNAEKVQREWTGPFLNSPLAKNLTDDSAKAFFLHFEDFRVNAQEVILHKGQIADHFYIIKQGHAKITQPDDVERVVNVGTFFGDESLVPNAPSSIQVEMLTQGVVTKINKTKFKKYIADSLLQHVNPTQLSHLNKDTYIVLDVRFPSEYNISPMPNSMNIPLQNLKKRMYRLEDKEVIFISQESGPRGELASYILLTAGYKVFILDSGISGSLELFG